MRNLDLLNELAYRTTKLQQSLSFTNHNPNWWISKLAQKLGELAGLSGADKQTDSATLRDMLFEFAALCMAYVEEIDRLEAIRKEAEDIRMDRSYAESETLNNVDFHRKENK